MKEYRGKNSWWLIIIVIIYNVIPLKGILKVDFSSNWWVVALYLAYCAGNILMIPIIINNKIQLFDDYFIFYYGFSKEIIYLKDIVEIKKSHNIVASSANSLDRIHIVTKNKEMYVSLKDNDGFIKTIKARGLL